MKLLKLIKKKLRTLRKRYILKKCIEKAGGKDLRDTLRNERLQKIRTLKRAEINSLVNSWKLKEISPPTEEEYYKFFFETSLTIDYINSVIKKYWRNP
jgi:hypothetical protein